MVAGWRHPRQVFGRHESGRTLPAGCQRRRPEPSSTASEPSGKLWGSRRTCRLLIGLNRHIVLADREDDARRVIERAYRRWRRHMEILWVQHGHQLPLALPKTLDHCSPPAVRSPARRRARANTLPEQIEMSGANYSHLRHQLGDITLEEGMRTVELLGREVMPEFAG